MDTFKVPKKIYRHVLKALNVLSNENIENGSAAVSISQILNQVKYQMKNLVPVPKTEEVIKKSLKNLCDIGLINQEGRNKFKLINSYIPSLELSANKLGRVTRNLFEPGGSLKRSTSIDTCSGDEFEKTRKRLRTNNKKIKYSGRDTKLPKAKQHRHKKTNNIMEIISLLHTSEESLASDKYNQSPKRRRTDYKKIKKSGLNLKLSNSRPIDSQRNIDSINIKSCFNSDSYIYPSLEMAVKRRNSNPIITSNVLLKASSQNAGICCQDVTNKNDQQINLHIFKLFNNSYHSVNDCVVNSNSAVSFQKNQQLQIKESKHLNPGATPKPETSLSVLKSCNLTSKSAINIQKQSDDLKPTTLQKSQIFVSASKSL